MSKHKYAWTAIYQDGSKLPQYNEDGSENLFKEIDQDSLQEFKLESGGGHTFSLPISQDIRLIYFRRIRMGLGGGNKTTSFVLGFQQTLNDINFKAMIEINEQGDVRYIRK